MSQAARELLSGLRELTEQMKFKRRHGANGDEPRLEKLFYFFVNLRSFRSFVVNSVPFVIFATETAIIGRICQQKLLPLRLISSARSRLHHVYESFR
jgi:hypothetical protein